MRGTSPYPHRGGTSAATNGSVSMTVAGAAARTDRAATAMAARMTVAYVHPRINSKGLTPVANMNVTYAEMSDSASRMRNNKNDIDAKLTECKNIVDSLTGSGFVTDQASGTFDEV